MLDIPHPFVLAVGVVTEQMTHFSHVRLTPPNLTPLLLKSVQDGGGIFLVQN